MKVYHVNNKRISFKLPKPLWSVTVGHGKGKYELLEIFAGFDIETTNINQVDADYYGWYAYAYHFQVSLYTQREQYVYLFRRWEVLLWFIDHVADVYNLSSERHIIWWVANLSFEFQFIRKRLKWDKGEYDFFAKEERQPLKATYRGIEFREALTISGGSLEQLAKDFCTTQKLVTYTEDGVKVSDLDYSIERNYLTPLSPDKEEPYCINDVVILAEFSQFIFNHYIRPEHYVPMTKTSILINNFKKRFLDLCKDRDIKNHLERGTSEVEYKQYIMRCFPDFDTYFTYMHYLFRGGYVHGNAVYAGLEVKCKFRDITSDYPARMNYDYVPVTPFKAWDLKCGLFTAEMAAALNNKCCIIHAVFDFIEAKTEHTIESKNKCVDVLGARWDNGRLYSADLLEVYLTELDFKIYQLFYRFAGVTILGFSTAERGKQPKFILDNLNEAYKRKNVLKQSGQSDTPEYAIEKQKVNTHYGAEVKRIRIEKTLYDFDGNYWKSETFTPDFEKEKQKQLLLPQWGIWVTAAARYEILTTLYKLVKAGVTVYYIDTDSIKHEPSHKAEDIFKHYNRRIAKRRRKRGLRDHNFDGLGEYDRECKGATVRFKTLGAKRYIFEYDGKIKATVAGMPKASIKNVGETNDDIFKEFSLAGFSLEPEDSNKLTTRYNDFHSEAYIDGVKMEEESSVALFKIPFTVTVTNEYNTFIEEQREQCRKL